jgi:hypothetical protein
LAANQFNDPPQAGYQFFIVNISSSYIGAGSAIPLVDVGLSLVGVSNVAYEFSVDCGVVPDEWDASATVFTGGSVTGNDCWSVRSTDAPTMVLFWSDVLSSTKIFFALK